MHISTTLLATLVMAFTIPSALTAEVCGGTVVLREGACHNDQDAQVCYDGVDEILCECPTGISLIQRIVRRSMSLT